jgi:hypothetical protein
LIREIYAGVGADPVAALAKLKAEENLEALFGDYDEFLAVITRKPEYLKDLM